MDKVKIARELVMAAKALTAEMFDEFPVVELWLVSDTVIDYMTTVSPENEAYSHSQSVVKHNVEKRGRQIRTKLERNLAELGMKIWGMGVFLTEGENDAYNAKIRFSVGTRVDSRAIKEAAMRAIR